MQQKNYKKFIDNDAGFSLIEISIAIIIIGIMISFSIKGYELVKYANISATVEQINQYKIAVRMYQDLNGSIPGKIDDKLNPQQFWKELADSKLAKVTSNNDKQPSSIGGVFSVELINGELFLILSNINAKQAYYIDSKIDDGLPNSGDITVDGNGCVEKNSYNTNYKGSCKLLIKMI